TNIKAFYNSKIQTLTDKDNLLASQISQIGTRAEDAHARITNEATASLTRDNAATNRMNTLQSSIDGTANTLALVQQTMSTQSGRLGNIEAQATLVVQAGNVITGWKLISNSGGLSQIVFQGGSIAFRNTANGINYPITEIVNGELRIPSAMIGTANIQQANIAYLAVGTNNMAINAVTDPYYTERTTLITGTNQHVNVLSHTFSVEVDAEVYVDMSGAQGFPSGDRLWEFGMYCDGSLMRPIFGGQKTEDAPNGKARRRVGPGQHTVHITWRGESSNVRLSFLSMIIQVVKR
ncbi:phage tail tip fiber protein, partial [Sphingobium sp. LSP13-1-1.1]|uniref:phage tail tip fiber protein n=1 Tax=Sphingobium sp. LSP13-1-1.1 TaxID=3135234 RepID=UPI00343A4015